MVCGPPRVEALPHAPAAEVLPPLDDRYLLQEAADDRLVQDPGRASGAPMWIPT